MYKIKNLFHYRVLDYLILIFSVLIWQLFGLGKVNNRLLEAPDQQIQMLTSAKMHYFNYSSYQSAWNHHSPFIHNVYKNKYHIFEFANATFGEYLLYTIILAILSNLVFNILNSFVKSRLLSFVATLCFIFDISSSTIGGKISMDNRTLGIILQSFILITCFKIFKYRSNTTYFLFGFFSTVLVYNLESYAVSVLFLFLFLFFQSMNKLNNTLYILFGAIVYFFWFFTYNFLNSDLKNFFDLNLIFHLKSIGIANNFPDISFLYLMDNFFVHGADTRVFGVGYLVTIFVISTIFYYVFFIKKVKNLETNEKLLIVFFLGETFHLYLTGPRFLHYSQIILLPVYILFILSIYKIFQKFLNSNVISNLMISFILFVIFFVLQFGDVVHNRTSLVDGTFQQTVESYKNQAEDPQLILTWVSMDKYKEVFFENNSLPSTRLWWWHQMKHLDKFYDKSYKMFDDELMRKVFLEDVKLEKPKIVVIDKSIIEPPDYFQNYVKANYQYTGTNGDLDYYQLSE